LNSTINGVGIRVEYSSEKTEKTSRVVVVEKAIIAMNFD
jgi:hypothetical protein